jgi:hypothetical protein
MLRSQLTPAAPAPHLLPLQRQRGHFGPVCASALARRLARPACSPLQEAPGTLRQPAAGRVSAERRSRAAATPRPRAAPPAERQPREEEREQAPQPRLRCVRAVGARKVRHHPGTGTSPRQPTPRALPHPPPKNPFDLRHEAARRPSAAPAVRECRARDHARAGHRLFLTRRGCRTWCQGSVRSRGSSTPAMRLSCMKVIGPICPSATRP